jgi:hypothetical protein
MIKYNPNQWYWIVAGSATEVWSSAGAAFVPISDPTYTAWLAAGYQPTDVVSAEELYEVLAAQYPAGIGPTLGPLTPQQYYDAAMAAGCAIVSASTPAMNGTYSLIVVPGSTDPKTLILGEQNYIALKGTFSNGQTTRAWMDTSGTPHIFPNTAEFASFGEAIAQYVDALQMALATALAGGTWQAPAQPVTIQ